VYPALALVAYVLFLASLASGLAFVLLVPVAVAAIAVALASAGQFGALIRLLEAFVRITVGAFRRAAVLVADLFRALFGGDPEPSRIVGAYGREALPELFRLLDQVAGDGGARRVDRVLVTCEANAAAVDLRREGWLPRRRRRVLVLGLPLVYTLSLDELRAVIAHEFGHFSLGHNTMSRATSRLLDRMGRQLLRMQEGNWFALDPIYWGVRSSYAIVEAIHLPWNRLREHEADRVAARVAGANHTVAMLRKLRDDLPAVEASLDLVADWCRRNRVAPRHLGEAAARIRGAMTPAARRRFARGGDGDPFDLRGRTHPPVAVRIAALQGLPGRPVRHPELAARYLPDLRNTEEHITKVLLHTPEASPTRPIAERIVAELFGEPAA